MYATRSSELLFNGTTIDANPSAFNVFSYLDNRYWGIKWLDTRFKKLLKQAKVTRYTGGLHTFRHTVATLLDGANVSPNKIQQHLGHSDVRTTLKMYIHNNDQDSEVSNELQSIRKSKRKTG